MIRLVLVAMLFCGAWSPVEAAGNGRIKFERRGHDFGQIVRGQVMKYRFKFKNAGNGPLRIQGVHAACGCTAVEADKGKIYQAGESGFVDVTLDSSDFAGKMMKVVTVLTNEKITPDRTLTVRAHVLSEFEVNPPLADFGDVVGGEGATRIIRVSPIGDYALKLKGTEFAKEVLDVGLTRDKRDWIVTVSLKPGLKPGFFKESVIVRTGSKSLPELVIPVRGTIRGNIVAAPNYLEFGALAFSDKVKRDISLSGLEEFQITGSRAELIVNGVPVKNPEQFVTVGQSDNPSLRKRVAVELANPDKLGGSVHGRLFLNTTDKGQPEVEVDFYAFFR